MCDNGTPNDDETAAARETLAMGLIRAEMEALDTPRLIREIIWCEQQREANQNTLAAADKFLSDHRRDVELAGLVDRFNARRAMVAMGLNATSQILDLLYRVVEERHQDREPEMDAATRDAVPGTRYSQILIDVLHPEMKTEHTEK